MTYRNLRDLVKLSFSSDEQLADVNIQEIGNLCEGIELWLYIIGTPAGNRSFGPA